MAKLNGGSSAEDPPDDPDPPSDPDPPIVPKVVEKVTPKVKVG